MKEVDYLIIGAGLAGTVLHKFLQHDSKVIVDPSPGRYKIGESFIPETYHHPVLRELVPKIKAEVPSYSPKWGTTFCSRDSIASFPLPPHGVEVSMHLAREELEPLMHREWGTPIRRERVKEVDLAQRVVTTDHQAFKVRRQILDCSGPAMVVARKCSQVESLWPVWSRWAYFDIVGIDNDRFWADIEARGLDYRRYDIPKGRILPGQEDDGWEPTKTTILTEIEQGLWLWQIPMYGETVLSAGLVSRKGGISNDDLFAAVEAHHAAPYTLERRARGPGSLDQVHSRQGFATKAAVPATEDYVLLADACAFADPIYSVGAGLAVNKAIELAGILNDAGWSSETCARWITEYDALITRAIEAFELWYDGSVLHSDDAASEVNRSFLTGTAFQVGIANHYSRVLIDSGQPADVPGPGGRGRHPLDAERAPYTDRVAELLGIGDGGELAGWTFAGAFAGAAELQHRWHHPDKPELIVNTVFSPDETRYYRRVGDISLSFMNLWDGPYPMDDRVIALFDELEQRIAASEPQWVTIGQEL